MSDDTASPLNNVITIDDERIKRLSRERSDIAGAEGFHSLEGNMCGTAMRGADALPGSKALRTARWRGRPRTRWERFGCRGRRPDGPPRRCPSRRNCCKSARYAMA